MMKKVLSLVLGLLLLVGCSGGGTTSTKAEDGDVVKIDFVGYLDGEAFEGGTAYGYNLELGSGSFIEGFEEQLVGAKKGEKRTVDLSFPENYHQESLAGKAVKFEVTVQDVYKKVK